MTDQLVKMVHFIDDDERKDTLNLEERLLQVASVNDRVAYMDKLEGLNKDFQTKVRGVYNIFLIRLLT